MTPVDQRVEPIAKQKQKQKPKPKQKETVKFKTEAKLEHTKETIEEACVITASVKTVVVSLEKVDPTGKYVECPCDTASPMEEEEEQVSWTTISRKQGKPKAGATTATTAMLVPSLLAAIPTPPPAQMNESKQKRQQPSTKVQPKKPTTTTTKNVPSLSAQTKVISSTSSSETRAPNEKQYRATPVAPSRPQNDTSSLVSQQPQKIQPTSCWKSSPAPDPVPSKECVSFFATVCTIAVSFLQQNQCRICLPPLQPTFHRSSIHHQHP